MKFRGRVVPGVDVGEKFGIATANLELPRRPKLREGVYLVRVGWRGQIFNGLLHFGTRKTFGGGFSIEVHLFDFSDKIYGEVLEIEVLKFFREVRKFQNADLLFTQIEHDIVQAKKFFLREQISEKWRNVSSEEREKMADRAVEEILRNKKFLSAKNVFVFAPIKNEVPFMKKLCDVVPDKVYFFPKVFGKRLEFFPAKFSELHPGKFGVLEPKETELPSKKLIPDLIFVPSVSAD